MKLIEKIIPKAFQWKDSLRINLQSLTTQSILCLETDSTKEIALPNKQIIENIEGKLDHATSQEGYMIGNKSKVQVIDELTSELKTFLVENSIFPSEKGMNSLIYMNRHGFGKPKSWDRRFVLSPDQLKQYNNESKTDKNWLASKEGRRSEGNIVSSFVNRGVLSKRKYSIQVKDNKARIGGVFSFHADINDMQKEFTDREKAKDAWERTESVNDDIEQMTNSQLRLECKAKDLRSTGKKVDLIARLKNS